MLVVLNHRNLINYANYFVCHNIDIYILISDKGILKKNLHKNVKIISLKKKNYYSQLVK